MAVSLEAMSDADKSRLAICYLYSNDRSNINWEAAHAAFDPEGKVKFASFKQVTARVVKKALEGVSQQVPADGDGDGEDAPKPTKAKAKTGGKRKKADADGDGEATPKPKKSRAKKKDKSEEKVQSSGDENADGFIGVKDESED